MRRLVDHCITHFWPDAADAPDPVAGLYAAITQATARMGAEWFAAGFVHGVLNTDNTNITGESFDYGPWRFLDRFDPAFTAAYFDHGGLYAFARQPEALNWNLARLGECLIAISSREAIEPVFETFAEHFQTALTRQTFARLGLDPEPEAARPLMHAFWAAMQASGPPFQQVFHDLVGGGDPARIAQSPIRDTYAAGDWPEVITGLRRLPPAEGLADALAAIGAAPVTLVIEEVEAIWAAIDRDDDWTPLATKIDEIRAAGAVNATLGLLRGPLARPGHLAILDG
jgi:serine/tyrosine/threonine adenylyltransferase